MTQPRLPTEAQAKLIAKIWSQWEPFNLHIKNSDGTEAYQTATMRVIKARLWIVPSGGPDLDPVTKMTRQRHVVSKSGLQSLAHYLHKERNKPDGSL